MSSQTRSSRLSNRRHTRHCPMILGDGPVLRAPAGFGLAMLFLALLISTTGPAPRAQASDCSGTQTGMVPLADLGTGEYKGFVGGLYGGGANQPPASHAAVAMARSAEIVPRGATGAPDPAGAVVLLSVGMSNTTQEFSTFVRLAAGDTSLHPSLRIIDGAQGGQTAADIRDPQANFWRVVDQRLAAAGSTPAQVQAVWLKSANRQPGGDGNPDSLPAARQLSEDIEGVVAVLRERFPNLGLVYLSSRIYAGYASSTLNPEPYAYESGLAVRWLIERQLAGEVDLDPAAGAPILLWGPYLWADGLNPRSDGLTWACSDFNDDGTHPANPGRDKVAGMLMDFFSGDDSSRPWFLADPDATPAPGAPTEPPAATPSSLPPRSTEEPTPTPFGPGTPVRVLHIVYLPALLRSVDVIAAPEQPAPSREPARTLRPPAPTLPPRSTDVPRLTATPGGMPSPVPTTEPPLEPPELGTVTRLAQPCRFKARVPGTSTCIELEIACPAAPPIRLSVAISEPPEGVASRGTIVFGTGGGGQGFYQGFGEFAIQALVDLNAAGYRIVQRSWGSDWEAGEAGMLFSSCRYATLITWLEAEAHDAGTAFCATGNSGGSAEIGYALARWGRDSILDYALLTGGPPMSRMDLACGGEDNAVWLAECEALEPEESNCDGWACLYAESSRGVIDSAYAGRPCQDRDLEPLLADSILAPEASLHYPGTVVGFIIGDGDCGNAPSQGMLYYRAITSETSLHVAPNTRHAVPSTREGAAAVRDGMLQGCRVDGGR